MKPRQPIKRYVAPRKRNPKRAETLFARNFHSRAFVLFVQRQPCASCGFQPSPRWRNQCSHAETRGMGGCGADWTRIFPQCPEPCHRKHERNEAWYTATDVELWIQELHVKALHAGIISPQEWREAYDRQTRLRGEQ